MRRFIGSVIETSMTAAFIARKTNAPVVEVTEAAHEAGVAAFGSTIEAVARVLDAYPETDRRAVARFLDEVLVIAGAHVAQSKGS